jgi:hypothetical protein
VDRCGRKTVVPMREYLKATLVLQSSDRSGELGYPLP